MAGFSIQHEIYRIRQPTETSCWATAFAMQLGARYSRCYSVSGLVHRIKSRGVHLNEDGTLPTNPDQVKNAARILGLDALSAVGSVTMPTIRSFLECAPVTLLGQFRYPARRSPLNHAVVMNGMWGDGTMRGTVVSLIDPENTAMGYNSDRDFSCSWWDLASSVVAGLDYVVVTHHRG